MKKVFLSAVLTAFGMFLAFASPAAVDFSALPKDEQFTKFMQSFVNEAYPSIRYSSQDKESKAALLKSAEDFYKYLQASKKVDYNQQVLKLLIMRCLYNYDVVDSNKIQEEVDFLNQKFPDNAEHHWIFGNYLVSCGKNVAGKKELEKFMEMKNYQVTQFFIEDYAYSQVMCGTYLNAMYTITNGGQIPEESITNKSLFNLIKKNIEETSVTQAYEQKDVWKVSQEQENGYRYVYSTMLGVSVPCKGTWKLNISSYTPEKPVYCRLGLNDFNIDGNNIGINMIVFVYPDSIFDDSVKQKFLNGFPVIKTEKAEIDKKEFEKYTFQDLSKYNDIRKGSKGFIYYSKIVPKKYSGARCEVETDFSKLSHPEGANPTFYQVTPSKKRLADPMHIIILVDSCVALEKQTSDLVEEILSKSVFE